MGKTLKERFEDKYIPEPNSGCWLWTACCNEDGYGKITVEHKSIGAHRVSWELYKTSIPDGMHVLHKCDNPPCVNPGHLFLGTNADNMADRDAKGRQARPRGEKQGASKLTNCQVREIFLSEALPQRMSDKFGVSQQQIHHIRTGKQWGHLTGAKFNSAETRSHLTEAQVLDIYADQRMQRDIAAEYGVNKETVGRIKRGISWTCVTEHNAEKQINL